MALPGPANNSLAECSHLKWHCDFAQITHATRALHMCQGHHMRPRWTNRNDKSNIVASRCSNYSGTYRRGELIGETFHGNCAHAAFTS